MFQFAFGFEGLETIFVGTLATFGRLRKWLLRFREISVITRQKSHTFDSEKVRRYKTV